jgi:hypothetical protein
LADQCGEPAGEGRPGQSALRPEFLDRPLPGGIAMDAAQRRDDRRIAQRRRPSGSRALLGLFSEPGAQDEQQEHIEEGGHDGVRAEAGVFQLAAEEIDGGAKLGVVAKSGRQVNDLGKVVQ